MRKYIFCLLALSFSVFSSKAQEDSLQTNRYVVRNTLYGLGITNVLDTYLSPVEYTGTEFRLLNERLRFTKAMDGRVSYQSLFQMNVSITHNKAETGSELGGLVNWNHTWHYQYPVNEKLKLLVGPMLDMNLGFLYNTRNSNNPAQAIADINIDASGMAIYHFNIRNYPFVARYQLNVPFIGCMFSPDYGQSYYEIFELEHSGNNILFTSIHNRPSFRQFITLDFPIKDTCLRVGYLCDIQQAKVNHLKSHRWSHIFMLGFTKNFYVIKGKKQISLPPHVNPF